MYCDRLKRKIPGVLFLILVCAGAIRAQSTSKPTDTVKVFSSTDRELIGLWSGGGEMIEFRSDGTCRYEGILYPYKLAQGHLILETPGGNVVLTYKVKAMELYLTANGHQSVYSRVPVVPAPKNALGGKRNPVDLAGKWCYVKNSSGTFADRCITLNLDGTYRYTVPAGENDGGTSRQGEDSGTWFVEGDRLYYQSASRGVGSYRLERRNHPINIKDPMIVLDNEPFVTTTPRTPWR